MNVVQIGPEQAQPSYRQQAVEALTNEIQMNMELAEQASFAVKVHERARDRARAALVALGEDPSGISIEPMIPPPDPAPTPARPLTLVDDTRSDQDPAGSERPPAGESVATTVDTSGAGLAAPGHPPAPRAAGEPTWEDIAAVWIEAARAGAAPTSLLRERFGRPKGTVDGWPAKLRKLGLIPPTPESVEQWLASRTPPDSAGIADPPPSESDDRPAGRADRSTAGLHVRDARLQVRHHRTRRPPRAPRAHPRRTRPQAIRTRAHGRSA